MLNLMQAAPAVDAFTVALRRSEAKAAKGPRTTRSTEASEPLADNALPDDWFKCQNCGNDCDPAEVKREYSDMELCSETCTAERIKSLECDLGNEKRVNALRKTALQKIMTATDARTVAGIPLTWFSVMGLTDKVRGLAVNGLYLVKDESVEERAGA